MEKRLLTVQVSFRKWGEIMSTEFQYFKIPCGENALALLGSEWIQEYGIDEQSKENKKLHFHNLMEIAMEH